MNTPQTAAGAERIDAVEVQERLDWQAMRAGQAASIIIDTATLGFLPNGPHQVAAMANLGAELLQEIQAYRPQFLFKSSPAEIVGALIEEMAPPTIEAKPQLATGEREEFDAWFGDTSKRGYVHNEVSAFSGWLAAKRAAIAAAPVQAYTKRPTPADPTDCDMIDFLELTGSVHWDLENCTIRFDIPDDLMSGSVREILTAAIVAYGEKA